MEYWKNVGFVNLLFIRHRCAHLSAPARISQAGAGTNGNDAVGQAFGRVFPAHLFRQFFSITLFLEATLSHLVFFLL